MSYNYADIYDPGAQGGVSPGLGMPDPLSWLWGGYHRPTMNQFLGGPLSPGGGMPGNPFGISSSPGPQPPAGVLAPPVPPAMPPVVPPVDPFTPPGGGGLAPSGPQSPIPQRMMPRGPVMGRAGGRDPRGGGGGSGGLGGGGLSGGGHPGRVGGEQAARGWG